MNMRSSECTKRMGDPHLCYLRLRKLCRNNPNEGKGNKERFEGIEIKANDSIERKID